MHLKWLEKLHTEKKHCAFCDLCVFQHALFCCYRLAANHISGDGALVVLRMDFNGAILQRMRLSLPNTDLRDPKLSVTPDGKLLLIAFARFVDPNNRTTGSHPVCWVSSTGRSWSSKRYFGKANWWLWRVRWQQNTAWGFAYNRTHQAIDLYQGDPRRTFLPHKIHALSLQKQGLGYPNESDIAFDSSGLAYAVVRRDADSFSAQLGIAKPPYKYWQWHNLDEYIGGPCMLLLNDNSALVAGRLWRNNGAKTAIWQLDLSQKKLSLLHILPSGGDTSYPGLVRQGNNFYMSYYSSHMDQHSGIYLAHFRL